MSKRKTTEDQIPDPIDDLKNDTVVPLGIIDNEDTRAILAESFELEPELELYDFPWTTGFSFNWCVFIATYRGDVEEAARVAGLNTESCRARIASLARLRMVLQRRLELMVAPATVATPEERKAILSQISRDHRKDTGSRIQAMTLIAKMEGELIDKRELSGGGEPIQLIVDTGVPRPDPDQVVTSTVQTEIVYDEGYEDMDDDEENA